MKVIIIENTVYKVSERHFKEIKNAEIKYTEEVEMSDWLHDNKYKYKVIGDVDYDFRL
jgi:hypothetical protein